MYTQKEEHMIFTCIPRETQLDKNLLVNGLKLYNGLPDYMKVPNLNRKKKTDRT
jgi:hypothetical protein